MLFTNVKLEGKKLMAENFKKSIDESKLLQGLTLMEEG